MLAKALTGWLVIMATAVVVFAVLIGSVYVMAEVVGMPPLAAFPSGIAAGMGVLYVLAVLFEALADGLFGGRP